jgi:hypothetical protein
MKQINNVLKINCESDKTLELCELTEFQGELKKREEEDVKKICNSIKKFGFSFPFFVWKHDGINHVLDGHGRLLALKKLDEYGWLIPPLPVVYVNCENEESAKDLLLRLNSNYGKMTKESVLDFVGDFKFDFSDYKLPEFNIKFNTDELEQQLKQEYNQDKKARQGFNLIIECESEEEQEMIYNELKENYQVRRC